MGWIKVNVWWIGGWNWKEKGTWAKLFLIFFPPSLCDVCVWIAKENAFFLFWWMLVYRRGVGFGWVYRDNDVIMWVREIRTNVDHSLNQRVENGLVFWWILEKVRAKILMEEELLLAIGYSLLKARISQYKKTKGSGEGWLGQA